MNAVEKLEPWLGGRRGLIHPLVEPWPRHSPLLLSALAHISQSYCSASKYGDKLIEVFRRTVSFPSNLYPAPWTLRYVSDDKYLFIERCSDAFSGSITKTFQRAGGALFRK